LRRQRLEAYAKSDGMRTAVKHYEDRYDGIPIEFLDAHEVYTKLPDGRYQSLHAQDSVHTFALLSSGLIAAIDTSLGHRYEMEVDALWVRLSSVGHTDLVCDGERTLVIDAEGHLLAEMKAPEGVLHHHRYLLYTLEAQVYVIDLKKVLRPAVQASKQD